MKQSDANRFSYVTLQQGGKFKLSFIALHWPFQLASVGCVSAYFFMYEPKQQASYLQNGQNLIILFHDLLIPRINKGQMGAHGFSYACPTAWNLLNGYLKNDTLTFGSV